MQKKKTTKNEWVTFVVEYVSFNKFLIAQKALCEMNKMESLTIGNIWVKMEQVFMSTFP